MYNNSIGFWACHIWTEIGKNEKLVASVKSAKVVICVGFLYDISFVDVFVGFGDYEKTISMPTKNRRFHKYNINIASVICCSMNRYLYIQNFWYLFIVAEYFFCYKWRVPLLSNVG